MLTATGIPVYVLAWKSPTMPAPAFWYFATRTQADTAAGSLQRSATFSIWPTVIAPLYQERIDRCAPGN